MLPALPRSPPSDELGAGVENVSFGINATATRLIEARDGILRVWDVERGIALFQIPYVAFDFERSGLERLAVISGNDIQLWDLRSGLDLGTIISARKGTKPTGLCFSPSGNEILVVYSKGPAVLWSLEKKSPIRQFGSAKGMYSEPSFGDHITLKTGNGIETWDVRTGKPAQPLFPAAKTSVLNEFFSPNDEIVIRQEEDTITAVDRSGNQLWQDEAGRVKDIVFGDDSNWVAVARDDRMLRVYDAKTGEQLFEPALHSSDVISIQCAGGDEVVALVGEDSGLREARRWKVPVRQQTGVRLEDSAELNEVTLSADGGRVAACSRTNMSVWETKSGSRTLGPWPHPHTTDRWERLFFSPDGDFLVLDGSTRTTNPVRDYLYLWNLNTKEERQLMHSPSAATDSSIVFAPDGQQFARIVQGIGLHLFETKTGAPAGVPITFDSSNEDASELRGKTACGAHVVFLNRNRILVSERAMIHVYDPLSGEKHQSIDTAQEYPSGATQGNISEMVLNSDHTLLAVGFDPPQSRVYRVDTMLPITPPMFHYGRTPGAQNNSGVDAIAFNATSTVLAIGTEKSISIRDVHTGAQVRPDLTTEGWVRFLCFLQRQDWLLSMSSETRQVWNIQTGTAIAESPLEESKDPTNIISKDGSTVITASKTARAILLDPYARGDPPTWLPDLLEVKTGVRYNQLSVVENVSAAEREAFAAWLQNAEAADAWVKLARQSLGFE